MIINLAEISPGGETFTLNRKSGELNTILSDLIGENSYQIEFNIRPLDQGFELRGHVNSSTPDLCSRCGIDIKIKIDKDFYEILLPKMSAPKHGEHYARVNHYTDLHEEDGPSIIEFENHLFNAGDYLHEMIGLQIPLRPVSEANSNGDCITCGLNIEKTNFGYDEPLTPSRENPFLALKDIKLN